MNMHIPAARIATARPVEDRNEIVRLMAAHAHIRTSREIFEPIPDEAMDLLTEAQEAIKDAIVEAPIHTSADLAAKLRFAATIVEDDEGGVLLAEVEVLLGALKDLANHRIAEARGIIGRGWVDKFYVDVLAIEGTQAVMM